MEDYIKKYPSVQFLKINLERNKEFSTTHSVNYAPALAYFNSKGEYLFLEQNRPMPINDLDRMIKENLRSNQNSKSAQNEDDE